MQSIKVAFQSLPDKIPGIPFYEVGLRPCDDPDAYQIIINSTFTDEAQLLHYQQHPAHQEAVALNRSVSHSKTVIDYPIEQQYKTEKTNLKT